MAIFEKYNEIKLEEQKALSNVYTLTAFFRSLIFYPYSENIINYLYKVSGLTKEDLQSRWDWFDSIFWNEEYWRKISALSFSTLIEANTKLLDKVILDNFNDKSIILEIAAWFSPRGIVFLNKYNIDETKYIETDLMETIELKKDFYNNLDSLKTPLLSDFNVIKNNDWNNITKLLKLLIKTQNIEQILIPVEWMLIYLNFNKQKLFFNNLKKLASELKKAWAKSVKFLSMEIPSHKNFTDWLIYEWFSHQDHIKVMNNVDSTIVSSLHKTDTDFFKHNNIPQNKINKYFYTDEIISEIYTSKLTKYKEIKKLDNKINKFLKQDIMYVWEWEI